MVEIEGVGGEFQVAIPFASLEPIRDRLDTVLHNDSGNSDARWSNALRDEIELSTVNISCRLAQKQLTLRDVLEFKPGDVIPMDLSQPATVCAEGIPVLRGKLGTINGNSSVRVTGQVSFPSRKLRSLNKEAIDE
ncbi:FliM/FliN family flagellar motor switch protein [Kaarinaea lacus]